MDKLVTDYSRLNPDETIAQMDEHIAGMTGNANFTALIPDAAAFLVVRDTANASNVAYKAAADALKVLLNTRNNDNVAAQNALSQRAGLCNIQKKGNRDALLTTRLPLVAERQPAGATPQVQALHLTRADSVGKVDAGWDSLLKLAKSYEVSVCINPLNNDPSQGNWTQAANPTASTCTIGPYTSGVRIWARVRAIGTQGPGDWSDPATIIVP